MCQVWILHPFNGPLSGTTWVSQYQKGKTNLDFTEARDSEWQWHQLGHMQVCTSLQTDNHASTPPLSFYRPDVLPAAQPIASKHWRAGLNMNKFSCYLCANFRSLRRKPRQFQQTKEVCTNSVHHAIRSCETVRNNKQRCKFTFKKYPRIHNGTRGCAKMVLLINAPAYWPAIGIYEIGNYLHT